jgi:hypothetical protein
MHPPPAVLFRFVGFERDRQTSLVIDGGDLLCYVIQKGNGWLEHAEAAARAPATAYDVHRIAAPTDHTKQKIGWQHGGAREESACVRAWCTAIASVFFRPGSAEQGKLGIGSPPDVKWTLKIFIMLH